MYEITPIEIGKKLNDDDDDDDKYNDDNDNDNDLDSNLNALCQYLQKYNNIDNIITNKAMLDDINEALQIKIINHWNVLCIQCDIKTNKDQIFAMYDNEELINCYVELKQYTKIDIQHNVKSLIQILFMIHEWFQNKEKTENTYFINIGHEWFRSYQRPLFHDLDSEIRGNFGKKEIDLYQDIEIYCGLLIKSSWNNKYRLCLNELISIKLYIECKTVQNALNKVFKSNSSILTRRKYFHLSFEIKKCLIYIGLENRFQIGMISLFNNYKSYLILNENNADNDGDNMKYKKY